MIGTMNAEPSEDARLHRMGIFTAAAIAIHNFPEGLAVFFSALSNQDLGVVIAATIALHNIPEGMAIAVPIYFATKSRMRAFSYSFLSGLAEPVGAIIGYALLKPFLSPLVFGIVLASVAGIMVYISLDELLPAAEEYGEHHIAISGLIIGMAVMAASLLMLF
jgi:ZIP family zinc transporter